MPLVPVVIAYTPSMRDELVRMWRESFEFGVGVTDPHSLEEQAQYFDTQVLPKNAVRVAISEDQLVGFVAASYESIAQLYVRVDHHRHGIGSLLLAWAKSQSTGSLWLYTFARNKSAQTFYEHHGFSIVARGFEPTWQLDDIKYS